MGQLEGATGLHHAQDADQSFLDRLQTQLFLGPGVFDDFPLMILERPLILGSEVFGVIHEPLRPLWPGLLEKVAAARLQAVIDQIFHLEGTTDRQMTLENDPVKTGQRPGNNAGEFDKEGA